MAASRRALDEDQIRIMTTHPTYRKAKGFRQLDDAISAWLRPFMQHRDGENTTRDPCRDWKGGAAIFALLEELLARRVTDYYEVTLGEKTEKENMEILVETLKELDVQPVAQGTWSAERLFRLDPAACWGLLVALYMRYDGESISGRALPPNVVISTVEKVFDKNDKFREGYDHTRPKFTYGSKCDLTGTAEEMGRRRTEIRAKYGAFIKKPTIFVPRLERDRLMGWVIDTNLGDQRAISQLDDHFKTGNNLVALLETLTNRTMSEWNVGSLDSSSHVGEDNAMKTLRMCYRYLESMGVDMDGFQCLPKDIWDGDQQAVYRFVNYLSTLPLKKRKMNTVPTQFAGDEDEAKDTTPEAAASATATTTSASKTKTKKKAKEGGMPPRQEPAWMTVDHSKTASKTSSTPARADVSAARTPPRGAAVVEVPFIDRFNEAVQGLVVAARFLKDFNGSPSALTPHVSFLVTKTKVFNAVLSERSDKASGVMIEKVSQVVAAAKACSALPDPVLQRSLKDLLEALRKIIDVVK